MCSLGEDGPGGRSGGVTKTCQDFPTKSREWDGLGSVQRRSDSGKTRVIGDLRRSSRDVGNLSKKTYFRFHR